MKDALKSDKFYDSTTLFIFSFLLIFLGCLTIIGKDKLYFNVVNIFITTILILGIFQFLRYFFLKLKPSEKSYFYKSLFYLLFSLILSSIRTIPLSILPLLFAIYMLCNGIIRLVSYIIMYKSACNGRLFQLFIAIIYFMVGIPLLISPIKNVDTMLIIVGGYTCFLGINLFTDFITNLIPVKLKTKLKRKFRITLPAILEAIIPYQVLREINYYIDSENYDSELVYEEKKIEDKPDLEVFIHVAPSGYNRFGHVDVCYEGKVISYGAYDFTTSKFFNMIGEGVIFLVDREKYINYCTEHSNKTLFCFGLKLTTEQNKAVKKQIDSILENVYDYETPYEKDLRRPKRKRKKNMMIILVN